MSGKRGPLNGTKLHPLSKHALGVLKELRDYGPQARRRINPGCNARLEAEDLTECYSHWPAAHICETYVRITNAGRSVLSEAGL